ncbi:MFS transporter [Modestobacter sp. VKM Ac-2986]|uniref:MFS transporter n=1 Tax=Modestobacter sp. VKM Ac-2986 TaxID=3004140 RepID=UPI0022AB3BA3|nr:MFS transporter [Modestobacter sp. VKM Ac-2986]MCZ2829160.1 MFS transporter [Modestobacter sp. VKM Ac-2986]
MTTGSRVSLDVEGLQRRTLRVLLASQVLAGAGLAAGVTVGALLAEDVLGSTGLAGLPAALLTLGSAAAAVGVGRLSQRSGRRPGLAAGYTVGAVGGAGVVLAAVLDSAPLLLVALLLYGSGSATNLQARYAGGDLAVPERRGRAVSTVLVATTVGAVAAPNLVAPMGSLAAALGIPELAGPFLLATVAYALAAVVVSTWLRPDPLLTARTVAEDAARSAGGTAPGATDTVLLRLGATAMVLTQLVMVALMTMTPVHMREHGHGLGAAGLVISLHIAAMFLPSPLTGRLVDRHGRRPVIAAAGVTLLAAGLLAAAAPADSVALLAVALVLLGLGWNLGLLAGTALLTDAVPLERRARTQGNVDVGVALAGAVGGLGSGLVVAATSFAALGLAGGLVALALVPGLLVSRPGSGGRRTAGTRPA